MKKDRLLSGFSGKLVAIIFSLVLVLAGVFILSPKGSEVLASDSSTPAFQVKELDIAEYTSRNNENNIVRTAPKPDANSDYKDWIFAGWYTDATCVTTVSKTTETGQYFAKFVPAEVLSAKCQVSSDTDESTSTSKLRIVSTVDSLKYSKVGFDLVFKDKTIPYSTNKVYSKIEAATEGVKYGFSPNIFDLQSEYFITATLINIKNEDFDEGILIKPYWVTKDGTKVYGVSRYARVEDSYLGIVNVPVRLYSDEKAASGTATVAYDTSKLEYQETYSSTLLAGETSTKGYENGYVFDGITECTNSVDGTTGTIHVTAASDADETTDGMLINLRLKIKDKNTLPKKNTFAVTTDLAALAPNVVYMYFKTGTYTGTADTQWYDTNTAGTEFVITTPEELYGFASLVNNSTITNQTVYLGADIIINSDWTAGETAPTYPWAPIGTFAGTFDGQGHAINGIYVNNTSSEVYTGLFQQISGTVQNLNLENSYVASNGLMTGSIAGFLSGDLIGVSSKAIVANTATVGTTQEGIAERGNECGGLVGRFGSGYKRTISNCWFDGTVTSNMRDLGGIVGRVAMGTKTIEHCLNTGVVTSNLDNGTWAGGLIGSVNAQGTAAVSLTLADSLNDGNVVSTYSKWVTGAVIGHVTKGDTVTIENSYATNESYTAPDSNPRAIGIVGDGVATNGNVTLCAESLLTGYTGYLKADLDFYADINKADGGYWVINADDTPTLKSFADNWADVGWYFDDDDITTYEISTVEEFYGLAALSTYYDFKGETIKLTADIKINEGDAKNWGTVTPKNAWTPIGKAKPFAGTFDGQGHTISGIYVKGTTEKQGLFGEIATNATICDLRLENSYIYGSSHIVGSIAGRGNGTYDTIYSNAIVQAESGSVAIGGIAGQVNANAKMSNCWFDGQVNQSTTGTEVGGFVGATSGVLNLTIKNCLNTGTISGATNVGGLVGQIRNGGTLTATNNLNVGTINATTNPGNILGNNAGSARIASSYGVDSYKIANGTITESNNAVYVMTAMQDEAAFELTGLDYTNYWVAKTGVTPELKSFSSDSDNLAPSGTQSYTGWYNSWDSEYTITTAAGLYGLSEFSVTNNFNNKKIYLGADIVLNEGILEPSETTTEWQNVYSTWNTWTPVGRSTPFAGTFDGQGHAISGIYVNITTSGNSDAGLFGQISGATIQNLRLENSYIYASKYFVGGIAGRGSGTLDTIYCNAIVQADVSVSGGIIGAFKGESVITNSWFAGNVNPNKNAETNGGIVGNVDASVIVKNCLNTGTISGTYHVGGMVGRVSANKTLIATNNLNIGTVSVTTSNVGHIVGNSQGTSKVANSYGLNTKNQIAPVGTVTEINNATYEKTAVQGNDAFVMTGLDFTDYWVAKEGSTPELKSFTSDAGSLTAPSTQEYTGWYNTWDSEYTITTVAGLKAWNTVGTTCDWYNGKIVKLGADIIINEGTLDPKGTADEWKSVYSGWSQWTPLTDLHGTFDGQGHTISGLYINYTTTGAALFRDTNVASTIKDLKLINSYIQGPSQHVGSIAGWGYGTLESVYSNAIVVGKNDNIGGLVGTTKSGTTTKMSNCWFDGTIIASAGNVGGLLGFVNDATTFTLQNCLFTGTITNTSSTATDNGGLCGNIYSTSTLNIANCLMVGTMNVDESAKTGKVVGNCAGTANLTGVYSLASDYSDVGTGSATGTVASHAKAELLGDVAKTNTPLLFEDGVTWTSVIDSTPILKVFAKDVVIKADMSWYDSSKKTLTINTAAELFGFAELSKTTNFAGKMIKLGADITTNVGSSANWATEAPINKWTPIVEFAGTFDGQGHTISGLYVYDTDGNAGLFAKTTVDSAVKNLRLTNSYIYGTGANNGSIAGTGSGTFDTIYSNAIVESSYYYVGGIVGYVCEGTSNKISNTWFDGKVVLRTATGYYAGGIVGEIEVAGTVVTLENCLNSGSISCERTSASGPYSVIGGLCGSAYTNGSKLIIKNSMHTGTFDVVVTGAVGTAVGRVNAGTVQLVGVYGLTGDYAGIGVTESAGITTGSVELMDATAIAGEGAFAMTGLDFTTYWVAKEGTTPEVKSFTAEAGSLTVPETQVYVGWYDGSGDYTITTAAGLYGLAQLSKSNGFTGETIKLGADITLNDGNATEWSSTNAPANVWQPMGDAGFAGTFDGQGHTISGMYVNETSRSGAGLFYWTKPGSVVKNLRLENSYVYSTQTHVGSISGYGNGIFDTIYTNTRIEASNYYVGGISGLVNAGSDNRIANCWFDGSIALEGENGYCAGGIVGSTSTSGTVLTIENCLNSGALSCKRTTTTSNMGGLCGATYGGTLKINNSLCTGGMTVSQTNGVGTAIGTISSGDISISNTYGLIGDYSGVGTETVASNGSVMLVAEEEIKGEGAFTMTGLDFTDKWAAVEGKTPELAIFSTAERLLPDGTWAYTGWYDGSGDYTITTAAGLYGFADLSKTNGFTGETIKLGADITLNDGKATAWSATNAPSNVWQPMGGVGFAGIFDGQGHTISGVYVNETSKNGSGLFYWTRTSSKIQNLRLENSYIYSTTQYVGSIAGSGAGIIENVYSDATVELGSAKYYIGGIVGYVYEGTTNAINNCWFAGEIKLSSGGSYAGGITGTVNGSSIKLTMNNCLNTGAISDTTSSYDAVAIAGLCGSVYGGANLDITNCLTTGEIKSTRKGVGTAVGYISNTASTVNITDTYAETNESLNGVGTGTANGTVTVTEVDRANLLGDNAKTNASALFTDGTTWTTITDGIPVLTSFKEYGAVESAETLLGAPLSRYRIVISEDATALMELLAGYLQSQVAEQTGVTLEIVSDATEVSDYEIVLGSTTREVSSLLYTKGTYSAADYSYAMKNEGNGISVGYSDSPALVDAFTKLLDVIAKDDATSLDITNTYDMSEIEKAENSYIRVMSSNVYSSKDTSFDYLGMPYQARAELLAECYLRYKPDFIGWQEADQVMRDEIYKYIASEYAMVEFDMSGYNNWCPIFYRKDLYNLEASDYYVLDSSHDCEWALYSSKSNQEEQFIHMNIHYNVSEATALSQAVIVNKMIKELMAEYPDVPLAITGDYNFTASESVFKTMMRGISDKVQSGSQILKNEDSKYYTWHILGNLELSETYKSIQQGPIDHVSITTDLLEAKEYKILHYPLICWAADHYPIFLDVAVK